MVSHMDLQEIFHDELSLVNQNSNILQQQSNDDELFIVISETDSLPDPTLPPSSDPKSHARQKRNKKRNLAHRYHRYKHYIIRVLHHRFRMKQIKEILHQFNIHYIHIIRDNNRVIIRVKSEEVYEQYHQRLLIDIFERESYHRRS